METKLVNRIRTFAQSQPDRIALSDAQGMQLSYRQLWQAAERIGQNIEQCPQHTDFAFVLANKGILQAVAIVAGLICNQPLAIIDLRQGSARVASMLNQGRSVIGIVDAAGEKLLDQINATGETIPVSYCLKIDTDSLQPQPIPVTTMLAAADISATAVVPNGTALIIYTSGSTGTPKGVCIGAMDLDARADTEQSWFELSGQDRILGVLPLNFDVGLTQLLGTLYAGGQYIFSASWLPTDIVKQITIKQPAGLAMSPMIWKGLLKIKDQERLWTQLNTLRYVTLSGGTLDIQEQQQIVANLHSATLIKTYGQTEMFRIASRKLNKAADALAAIGNAYPGVEFFITDDHGLPVTAGHSGNISARGMGQMIGYVGNPVTIAGEPILTGDLGFIDSEGRLTISGRKSDMIKILDQRVFPQDVANSIKNILQVSDAVVIATDDSEPKLLAVVEIDIRDPQTEQLMLKTLRQQLASHLVPRRLYCIDRIPATLNGKVNTMAIREFIREQEKSEHS